MVTYLVVLDLGFVGWTEAASFQSDSSIRHQHQELGKGKPGGRPHVSFSVP